MTPADNTRKRVWQYIKKKKVVSDIALVLNSPANLLIAFSGLLL